MFPTMNDLPQSTRESVIALLNARLADLVDLHSQIKQAHWNVRGPAFIALHELFDEIAEQTLESVDEVAERVTQLGGVAIGTVRLAANYSSLKEYPSVTAGMDHVRPVAAALAHVGKLVRANIDAATELKDADTADLFTGLSRQLDKHLWLVESHLM